MAKRYLTPRKLANGVVVYPKRGWEPPPPIEGYRRKSTNPRSNDAWVFIPEWMDCPFRVEEIRRRENCRCLTLVNTCTHPKMQGRVVGTAICEACTLRDESNSQHPD